MDISGFQKLTLLNYPKKVACTLFTGGCNLRCPFCQNVDLVYNVEKVVPIDKKEVFKYLEERRGQLEGVCITGGEPLLHKDIKELLYDIKNYGYKIKLDTNGYFPDLLNEIINENLVDMIAMDIKSGFSNYDIVAGIKKEICYVGDINSNIKDKLKEYIETKNPNWAKSIKIITNSNLEYEFRTTCVKGLHNIYDFYEIREMIKGAKQYFLQNYHTNEQIKNLPYESFMTDELNSFKNVVDGYVDCIEIRA